MAVHPSILKAREILARRQIQEDEHEIWRAQHVDELDAAELDALVTRRAEFPIIRKTTIDKQSAGLEFVLSDATPDRFGDVIDIAGWQLQNFNRNPIALFSHDKNFIVGKWQNVGVTGDALRGHLHLAPQGVSPRIDEVIKLVEADVIRAVSVGFRPIEEKPLPNGGTRYVKSELIECSLVSTPANANALAVAKKLRVSDEVVRMCFDDVDDAYARVLDLHEQAVIDGTVGYVGEETAKLRREIATLRAQVLAMRAQIRKKANG